MRAADGLQHIESHLDVHETGQNGVGGEVALECNVIAGKTSDGVDGWGRGDDCQIVGSGMQGRLRQGASAFKWA